MTTHLQSEHLGEGLSRRGLVQALAAGTAAASVATPALADSSAVLAEATSADYARDPTRWGSAGSRGPVSGIQASRHPHQGRHHSRAPWRFRPALADAARQSEQSRVVVRGRRPAFRALSRGSRRSARLRRLVAARARPQPRQLQLPRHGRGHDRGHGEPRPPAVLPCRSRSRRAAEPSPVPRSPGSGHEALPPGHAAELLRVDQREHEVGPQYLALAVHGAAGAVS